METLERLRERLEALKTRLVLEVRASDRTDSALRATLDLLHEMVTADSPVHIDTHIEPTDGVTITIRNSAGLWPVSFWGTPSGFELEGLVSAIEAAADVGPALPSSLLTVLGQIVRPLSADLYVAPT